MKASKLREQTDEELQQLCDETQKSIFELRAKQGIGEASDHPLRIRNLKRNLGRIKTVMRERRLAKHG